MARRLLNVEAAAEYLAVQPKFIYRLVNERRIPFHKLGDTPKARLRFDIRDLDAWLDAHRIEAAS